MTSFDGLIAVLTGGGTGIGREITIQLAAAECNVAICDVSQENMDETRSLALAGASDGVRITTFVADVSDFEAMEAFATHVRESFASTSISLLFNNAGIGGGASVVTGDSAQWDRVFGVCWGGVLNGTRAFMPMLVASSRGHVVNTSSINGMWACLGPLGPHTAYSAAKFAVKGFTEALTVDFRVNAPHLTASVVMPGHIGTSIMRHSFAAFGADPKDLPDAYIADLRLDLARRDIDVSGASDEDLRNVVALRVDLFENAAPTTASDAATAILEGVQRGDWRILVGDDAHLLDAMLRDRPAAAYTDGFMAELRDHGHFAGLIV